MSKLLGKTIDTIQTTVEVHDNFPNAWGRLVDRQITTYWFLYIPVWGIGYEG